MGFDSLTHPFFKMKRMIWKYQTYPYQTLKTFSRRWNIIPNYMLRPTWLLLDLQYPLKKLWRWYMQIFKKGDDVIVVNKQDYSMHRATVMGQTIHTWSISRNGDGTDKQPIMKKTHILKPYELTLHAALAGLIIEIRSAQMKFENLLWATHSRLKSGIISTVKNWK